MDQKEAGDRVFRGPASPLRDLWERLDGLLAGYGLARDVKTIYVSYTDPSGAVVAAAQPVGSSLEVALAVTPDTDHPLLRDAIYLKWKTLPKAVSIQRAWDCEWIELEKLIARAVVSAASVPPRATEDFVRFNRARGARPTDSH